MCKGLEAQEERKGVESGRRGRGCQVGKGQGSQEPQVLEGLGRGIGVCGGRRVWL